MSTVYPAAIIPLFPEKRVVGNTDEAFVAQRMRELEAYMGKVAHHPSLSQSLDLLVFLDASDAGLEAAKCYIEAGACVAGQRATRQACANTHTAAFFTPSHPSSPTCLPACLPACLLSLWCSGG
jgi:hypothetical protein